jgi:hypothetical protein
MVADVNAVDGGGVTLNDRMRMDTERVVVCAGPDTCRLMGLTGAERPRTVRSSFVLREPLEPAAPCWIQRDERLCEPL